VRSEDYGKRLPKYKREHTELCFSWLNHLLCQWLEVKEKRKCTETRWC